jgi:hypothetical protein
MKVGETWKDERGIWFWVRCPNCNEEREARRASKYTPPLRLCKPCNKKRATQWMSGLAL